jgi:hypothetical protein
MGFYGIVFTANILISFSRSDPYLERIAFVLFQFKYIVILSVLFIIYLFINQSYK